MSKRSPKSVEEKVEVVRLYLDEELSIPYLSRMYNVSQTTIKAWVRKYKSAGIDGLLESRTWKKYSQELKQAVVEEYLDGQGSLNSLVEKYHISDISVLRRWIKRYISGKELTATSKGMSRMKQGRKTTFEERLEIVHFTRAHGKDYQAAIEQFDVSYQQIYSWVRKFEKDGPDALLDRRGKGLESKPNLTTEEALQLKIKLLEEQNRQLEMEVGLLKKLEEIEQRHRR